MFDIRHTISLFLKTKRLFWNLSWTNRTRNFYLMNNKGPSLIRLPSPKDVLQKTKTTTKKINFWWIVMLKLCSAQPRLACRQPRVPRLVGAIASSPNWVVLGRRWVNTPQRGAEPRLSWRHANETHPQLQATCTPPGGGPGFDNHPRHPLSLIRLMRVTPPAPLDKSRSRKIVLEIYFRPLKDMGVAVWGRNKWLRAEEWYRLYGRGCFAFIQKEQQFTINYA